MFENVGLKIKAIAKIFFVIQVIASVMCGLFILAEGELIIGDIFLLVGPVILILGPVCSWMSALFVYGFGELIENTKK